MLNILLKLKSNVCKYKFFVTSITLVLLFYYPALIYPKLTSYLFAGENFMLWWPQLINVISNFGEYNFYGFDMSTFGGSSEIFFRPNIMVYNPALIFASIFHSKLLTFDSIIFLAVLFFMFFSFLSVYFAQKLMYEHLNLEYVLKMWSEDSPIDVIRLDVASKNTAKLHAKYLEMLSVTKLQLKRRDMEFKVLLKNKWLWYNGKMPKDQIDQLGWEYDALNGLKILKGEMDYYYNADPHIQEAQSKIDYLKTLIETLEEIINNIRWRHSTIKNMIDWRRFESGG